MDATEINAVVTGQTLLYFSTEFQPTNRPRLFTVVGPGAKPHTVNGHIAGEVLLDVGRGGKPPLTLRRDVPLLRWHPKRMHDSGSMAIFPATLMQQVAADPSMSRFVEGYSATFADAGKPMPAPTALKGAPPPIPLKPVPKPGADGKSGAGKGAAAKGKSEPAEPAVEIGKATVMGGDGGPLDALQKHPRFHDELAPVTAKGGKVEIHGDAMVFASTKGRILCGIGHSTPAGKPLEYRLFLPPKSTTKGIEGEVVRSGASSSRAIGPLLRLASLILEAGLNASTAADVTRAYKQAVDTDQPRE